MNPKHSVTIARLASWKALGAKATLGPWKVDAERRWRNLWVRAAERYSVVVFDHWYEPPSDKVWTQAHADFQFLAAARAGWPATIALAEALLKFIAEHGVSEDGEGFQRCNGCEESGWGIEIHSPGCIVAAAKEAHDGSR